VRGGGGLWRSWFRHCTTGREVRNSIPSGVLGNFEVTKFLCSHSVAAGSTHIYPRPMRVFMACYRKAVPFMSSYGDASVTLRMHREKRNRKGRGNLGRPRHYCYYYFHYHHHHHRFIVMWLVCGYLYFVSSLFALYILLFVLIELLVLFVFLFCMFSSLCSVFLCWCSSCLFVCFLFVYKIRDSCHWVGTQLQLINSVS
jgi:hypothetical protein